jgi:hypothetical protein
MLTFAISVAIMLGVLGVSFKWYERAERRRDLEEGHASDH